MYYKIKDSYRLVGWRNLPTGLRDTKSNQVLFFPKNEYKLLVHLNGREDINTCELQNEQKDFISYLLDKDLIEKNTEPFDSDAKTDYQFFDCDMKDSVCWSITGKCNYKCRHCFLSAPDNRTEDLSTAQCVGIIRQIADCGIGKISFTGGEPLFRQDFPELVKECSRLGIRITEIFTNGALLSPEIIKLLIDAGQRPCFKISYDGVGWHDWTRGKEGAQEAAEKALILAGEAGFETSASMCLFKDNVPKIRETVNRMAKLNVSYITISSMLPLGLWGKHYKDKTLSRKELLQVVLNYIPQFYEDGKPCSLKFNGYFVYDKKADTATCTIVKNPESPLPTYPCSWAAYNAYISSAGTVLPCMALTARSEYDHFPNLISMPLLEILRDSVFTDSARTTLKKLYDSNRECMECKEKGIHCGSICRANSKPDFCDLNNDVCQFVKNGWFELIKECVEKSSGRFQLTTY